MGFFGKLERWGKSGVADAIRENFTHPHARNPERLVEVRLPSQPDTIITVPSTISPGALEDELEGWADEDDIVRVNLHETFNFSGLDDAQVLQACAFSIDPICKIPDVDFDYLICFFRERFRVGDEEDLNQIGMNIDQCESMVFLLLTYYGRIWKEKKRTRREENRALKDIVVRAKVILSREELIKAKKYLRTLKIGGCNLLVELDDRQRDYAASLVRSDAWRG